MRIHCGRIIVISDIICTIYHKNNGNYIKIITQNLHVINDKNETSNMMKI